MPGITGVARKGSPWHDAAHENPLWEATHVVDRAYSVPATRNVRHAAHADRLHPLFRRLLHRHNGLIGVIIAHVKIGNADPLTRTHYQFQIRTFWIGILYLVVGAVLAVVVIGILVLLWWFIWSLVRNVKGVLALNDNKPIRESGLVDVRMNGIAS